MTVMIMLGPSMYASPADLAPSPDAINVELHFRIELREEAFSRPMCQHFAEKEGATYCQSRGYGENSIAGETTYFIARA
ncbi:hypothetical protein [Phenylobacterium sp.]|uniref:hypothetical protein n=1 Tax=Phenylobacterium sp. TaxID=1871053 RepID=UPI0025E7CF88|nr:hypothetical protein [Phenylobacterium sp.]